MDALTVLVISIITPKVLEMSKRWAWFPLMQQTAPILNRVTPAAVALIAASGTTWAFDQTTGILTIKGLIPQDILRGILLWIAGAGTQELVYRRAIKG